MPLQRSVMKYICYFILFQCMTSSLPPAFANKRVDFHQSVMSSEDVIGYIKSFLQKSSLDMKNEKQLALEDYAEDLYSKIDDLMPAQDFANLLKKTRDITDKVGQKKYGSSNAPCNPSTIFKPAFSEILEKWNQGKNDLLDKLRTWQKTNERLAASEVCNRFRGLTCQNGAASAKSDDAKGTTAPAGSASCKCDGDPKEIGFFKPSQNKKVQKKHYYQQQSYPEGCYVKPWKHCTQLFIQDSYFDESHGKRILTQIIFPVGRTHKCKQGTNCLDLIPGLHKPICWCNEESEDEECKHKKGGSQSSTGHFPHLNAKLMGTRKNFMKLLISASNKKATCSPEYNEDAKKLANGAGLNPTLTGTIGIMEKLIKASQTDKALRICDFRKTLLCDPGTMKCKENLNCGPLACAQGYICKQKKGGKKSCIPDCKDPMFASSQECAVESVSIIRTKGRNFGAADLDHPNNIPHEIPNPKLNSRANKLQRVQQQDDEMSSLGPEPPEVTEGEILPTENPCPGGDCGGDRSPAPPPPPTEKPSKIYRDFGDPCQSRSECDPKTFLDCRGEVCGCAHDLWHNSHDKSCEIPFDGNCHKDSLLELYKKLNYELTEVPPCFKGKCSSINGDEFCRPSDEDGSMFVTEEKKNKIPIKGGGGILGMSQLWMFVIIGAAGWNNVVIM